MSERAEGPASRISLMAAICIVVANMVGTGVFTSLGFQVMGIPSGMPVLVLWLLGGVLSFCGAVCYGELAAMMPRSGGEYHLLTESYHPLAGFLSGWVSVTVGFAAPTAAAGLAFGTYLHSVLPALQPEPLATLLVIVISAVHLGGIGIAGPFQVVATTGKILLILILAGSAWLAAPVAEGALPMAWGDWEPLLSPAFGVSLFWVMYAYSGWNAAAYVAGEMADPGRNVPRALILGTGLVTVLYVALNMAFLRVVPVEDLKGQLEVGHLAAKQIFGAQGGAGMALLISFGLISTLSSMIWAGPRVTQVMGEDYRLFRFLAVRNRQGAPHLAILAQALVVILLIWFALFEQIILYIQAILTLSSLLVVGAVIYLRIRQPGAPRPYRTWGYPVTPLLFLAVSVYMLVVLIRMRPLETAWGGGTLLVGVAVYAIARRCNRGQPEGKSL